MELNVKQRVANKKTENKTIRREGGIPAIVYSQGKEGVTCSVDKIEFQKALNQLRTSGTLSTTIFSLKNDKKITKALLKDIQYHVVSYDVLHLDFIELIDSVEVDVNVPIQCIGVMDCVGIKLGGNLRQVVRAVKVRCLPKNVPSQFEIDIRELNVGQGKRVSDIEMPKGVRPLMDSNSLAVVIAKR
jgi:large subunit ribosomal protein L25